MVKETEEEEEEGAVSALTHLGVEMIAAAAAAALL